MSSRSAKRCNCCAGSHRVFADKAFWHFLRAAYRPELTRLFITLSLFAGLVPVMFSYGGWQNLNFVAEEVKDPLRNLPRAIMIGVLCVIAVYVSANIAYVHVLSAPVLEATKTPAADVAGQLLGATGAGAITILIVISSFGF
ncbi:MAG: amino acid permease [Blastocatellia bacterium]